MRIQHNIMAMNAYRNYNTNTSALSKNLEKLSSGYKINRAGDDAAGLAISEKMRAQITGLEVAQKNAKDGISLVQTAEGALTEVHDMLNRMVELANQSANGTYENETDRAQLQKEVDQLRSEINRIADSANFNGINLLDGTLADGEVTLGNVLGDMVASTDGVVASDPVTAKYTLTMDHLTGGDTLNDGSIFAGLDSTATTGDVGACSITLGDGTKVKVSDLFDVTGDTTGFTLTAKKAGATAEAVDTAILGSSSAALDTAGVNAGQGAPASKAKYELTFDMDNLLSGGSFQLGGKTFTIYTGGAPEKAGANEVIIDLSSFALTAVGADSTKGIWGATNAIFNALEDTFGEDFDVSGQLTAAPGNTTDDFTVTLTAKTAGSAANMGEVRFTDGTGSTGVTADYTEGKDTGKGSVGSFATKTYELDLSRFQVGDKLSIGGVEIEVVEDADADASKGKVTLADLKDGDKLAAIFESQGYASGKLEFDLTNKTVTITGTTEGQKAEAFDPQITATNKGDGGKVTTNALTLQIGDTSDTWNQLEVSIADCHVKSLGIDDIDISSQEGAQAAVDQIKDAINYISDVRGTLGATQNRLDHTINNLSVMTENIQDAESTIRDTDVADEMMAYTKNNILIQSAQAMLAQANQVPQGVLQLLQ